jgi:hypothetical protein
MSRKFFRDISASTLQVLINQLLGLAVFLFLSICLSKDHYGELNWSLSGEYVAEPSAGTNCSQDISN